MKRIVLLVGCLVIAACGSRPEAPAARMPEAATAPTPVAAAEPLHPGPAVTPMAEAPASPGAVGARPATAAPAVTAEPEAPVARYGVAEFMRQPTPIGTPARVRGVVSSVAAADRRLTLIDEAEYRDCGATTCAELALPVSWPGPYPAPGATVELQGSVVDDGGRRLFAAARIVSGDGY